MQTANTIDDAEVAKFSAIADEWWDENGKFKPLHRINPARIAYIRNQICNHFGRDAHSPQSLANLSLLDIGCGGGLIAEPMARLGAQVTGLDASEKNITVATLHAARSGLPITYRHGAVESLAGEGAKHDVVLALEVIEHVANPASFVQACAAVCKPGGLLIFTTLNRTAKSFALAIVGAEYVLRWLPRGTHDWNKFITPAELASMCQSAGLNVRETSGMILHPLRWQWQIHPSDTDVNYLLIAAKPA